MKHKITVPISLVDKIEKFGIIPNKNKIVEDQLFALWELGKVKSMPSDLAQFVDLSMRKINVNPDRYAGIIDILAFPYGGQDNGRDCDGEFFHPGTNFMQEYLPYPPIFNAHGIDTDGTGASRYTVVGETLRRWNDERGGWVKAGIFKDTPYTEDTLQSYNNGTLKASSYALLKDTDSNIPGKIDVWLAGEISTITPKSGIEPCNLLAGAAKSANQKSEAEILQLINEQEEPYRTRLKDLLDSVKEMNDDVPIGNNENPINPEGELDDDSEEVDYNNEDNDMTPEQIQELVSTSVAAALANYTPPAPAITQGEGNEPAEPDGKQKSAASGSSFLKNKIAATRNHVTVNKDAGDMVDLWIEQGMIDPQLRLQTISNLGLAIEADAKTKGSNVHTENFCTLIESGLGLNSPNGTARAFGFGKNDKLKTEANDAIVSSMIEAIGDEVPALGK